MTGSDERSVDASDDAADERERAAAALAEARRKRRRDAVFGDSAAVANADELVSERPEAEQARRDEELRRDVPPHHG